MKDSENKSHEWGKPLDEYIHNIQSVKNHYEPDSIHYLFAHIRANIWQSDYLEVRGMLEDSIAEIEKLIVELPDRFKKVRAFEDRFGVAYTQEQIVITTTNQLNELLSELQSIYKKVVRRIKASLPNGIEKDGIRIKTHLTAETLVAFFKALREEDIVFDKGIPNVLLAKFISDNFATDKSVQTPLSIDYLEDLISSDETSVSIQFKAKLKRILRKIE
jgi:hypothetical protein